MLLSVMLFWGIVPVYKAGAYIRPTAGGSGPLVEAIGPPRLLWLSWAGTSLFFLDAVLTIIISSISAADVLMLLFPEFAPYRILIAEVFAFFIMAVLVAVGPKRAVPLFLLGGGAFSIFTLMTPSLVGYSAVANPEWGFLTSGIVHRLEEAGSGEFQRHRTYSGFHKGDSPQRHRGHRGFWMARSKLLYQQYSPLPRSAGCWPRGARNGRCPRHRVRTILPVHEQRHARLLRL